MTTVLNYIRTGIDEVIIDQFRHLAFSGMRITLYVLRLMGY